MVEGSSMEGGAEAILNLQPSSSIGVAYHQDFGPHDDLLLLELDEKMLPDILSRRYSSEFILSFNSASCYFHEQSVQEGIVVSYRVNVECHLRPDCPTSLSRVTIRGQLDEDAVLCTKSKTYSIKFVGTSNSVFLIPPSGQPTSQEKLDRDEKYEGKHLVASAIKLAPGNMELVEVAPRLDKLRPLLSKNLFGPLELSAMEVSEDRGMGTAGLYTWDDLIEQIQASDEELRLGLKALSAIEINSHWRILDDKYMENILSMILNNVVLNDWSLDGLNENEVVSVLEADGFPSNLVVHCLDVHGKIVNRGVDGVSIWQLDERHVCVNFARGILRGGKMRLETFMDQWTRKIPRGMQPSLDMLDGEILTEQLGIETWVHGFSVSSLPFSAAERFAVLFRERPKWEEKDLQPYIRDLRVPGLSSEGLLLKYTRRSQPTAAAEPIFSAR